MAETKTPAKRPPGWTRGTGAAIKAVKLSPYNKRLKGGAKIALKRAFLEAYSRHGIRAKAEKEIGVGEGTANWWRKSDPEFAAAYTEAGNTAADMIEAEVYRRAVEGIEEPLVWQGQLTGDTVRKYSDGLLGILIKAHKPERFRERYDARVQASGVLLVVAGEGRLIPPEATVPPALPALPALPPDPSTIMLPPPQSRLAAMQEIEAIEPQPVEDDSSEQERPWRFGDP